MDVKCVMTVILGQSKQYESIEIIAMHRCTGLPLESPILPFLRGKQSALAINELQFLIRCMFRMVGLFCKINQFCLDEGLHVCSTVLLLMSNVKNGRFVE